MKTDIQSDNDSKGKDGSDRDDKDRGRDRERTRRGDRPSRFSSGGRDRSPVRDRKRGGDRRVYVSNVAYESRWQDVKDLFRAEVGEVTFVEMFVDENDKPRGCGIVEFETPELAAKAVEKMHRFDLKGRKLVVKEDFDVERDKYGRPVPSRNRGGGDREANNSSLNSRRDDGPPRNNSWDNPNSQLSALASLTTAAAPPATNNPSKWGNLYGLSPQFLESLWINGPLVNKVFVANLDYKVDEKKLREVFKLAGKVVHAEISMDKEGKSRGFGVVEYEHPVEAVQAISMLHNQTLFDRRLTVRMDRNNDKPEGPPKLPEGLKGLGMGLGTNGAPLTDVARNLPMIQQSPLMGLASNVQSSLAAAACAAQLGTVNQTQLANLTGSGPLGTGLGSVGGLLGQSLNVTEHLASLGANQAFAAPTLNSSQPLSSGLSSGLNPGISTNLNSGLSSGLNSGLNSSLSSGLNSNLSSGLSSGLNSSINSNMNSGLGSSLGHGMGGTAGLGNSPFSNSLSSNSAFMGGSGGNNSGYGNAASANVGSYGSTGRDFDSMSAALSGANAGFNNLDRDNYRGNNNNMGGMGNMGGNFGNGPSRPMGNIGNNIGMQNTSGNRVSDTIVIKNLPPNTTWTQLRDKFRDVGDVKFAEMRGKDGIVRFNSEWDAERAVREMDRTRYEGRTIDVLYYY